MEREEIMDILDSAYQWLDNVGRNYMKRARIAQELVTLHNKWCEACNCFDDIIYDNTEDNLVALLPGDPLHAFYEGRQSSERYSVNDTYLTIDGYGHPVSCTISGLVDKFIWTNDIARWLLALDDYEQLELLEDLASAMDYELPER